MPPAHSLDRGSGLTPYVLDSRPGAKSINGSEDAISLLVTVFIRKGAA